MAKIELAAVTVAYDAARPVLDAIDLTVDDGEFLVLVGPSGSGKTTALRVVAGLRPPTSGQVLVDGVDVTDVPPADRDLAMVFQSYALYPHMTVRDNMAFGLRLAKVSRAERAARVSQAAEVLGLTELLDRRPKALSGGQRQRVAMGRAIVRQPRAFLMDEPLSNLDAKLRVRMRAEVARIQRSLGTTTLYVTHDQTEAMTMADRIAVLHEGVLQQVGTPTELFDQPANVFVAAFIGSPPTNFVPGVLISTVSTGAGTGTGTVLRIAGQDIALPAQLAQAVEDCTTPNVLVGVRPHDLSVAPSPAAGSAPDLRLELTVDLVERLGTETLAHGTVEVGRTEGTAAQAASAMVSADEELGAERAGTRLTAALGSRVDVAAASALPLYARIDRIHLFDAETGTALRHADRELVPA